MAESNAAIAAIFDEIADLLDIQGANPFRVLAYRNGARSIGDLGTEIAVLLERGTNLRDVPGIGEDLAKKIEEILATGSCEFLERLNQEVPPGLTELLKIPGLGPRRVKLLYDELQVESLEHLIGAAQAGRIRGLPRFGEKTEEKLLAAARKRVAMSRRYPLALAASYAYPLAEYLRSIAGVRRVEIAGSFRRMRPSIGDLDIVVVADDATPVMDRFTGYIETDQTISKGPTRASVVLRPGLQVDLRCVAAGNFGAAMVYFTGSKAHNVAIRRMAQTRGLKMNEYGVFRDAISIAGETEEAVYATVDLPWIAPELRENRGEIEAALAGTLPDLVEHGSLRGDLNVRSKGGGGADTLETLVAAAEARGFEYLALMRNAEHLRAGDDATREELAEIDRFNSANSGFTLLKGIEVDIREDGALEADDDMLAACDLVCASISTALQLPRAQQTERIMRALQTPRLAVLALPRHTNAPDTGTVELDVTAIMRKARERNVAVEISLHGRRVPLLENYCAMARQEGVLLSISADASRVSDFEMLPFTTGSARRAWIEKAGVLNARPLAQLRDWLRDRAR